MSPEWTVWWCLAAPTAGWVAARLVLWCVDLTTSPSPDDELAKRMAVPVPPGTVGPWRWSDTVGWMPVHDPVTCPLCQLKRRGECDGHACAAIGCTRGCLEGRR